MKNTTPTMIDIIRKSYPQKQLKKLQKNASVHYPELKDSEKFNEWMICYCVESLAELLEEYEVED
jgi:hypothetical protein